MNSSVQVRRLPGAFITAEAMRGKDGVLKQAYRPTGAAVHLQIGKEIALLDRWEALAVAALLTEMACDA